MTWGNSTNTVLPQVVQHLTLKNYQHNENEEQLITNVSRFTGIKTLTKDFKD